MNNISKSILVTTAVLMILLLSNGLLLAKSSEESAIKANYVLKEDGKSPQIVTIWKSSEFLAVSFDTHQVVGVWQNWNSSNPTFYQVYPNDEFRIEFSRMESQQQVTLMKQLKELVGQSRLLERKAFEETTIKNLHLSTVEEGPEVAQLLRSWANFSTYDYADIGDNEAIPELATLIHQGFVPNF
ncbi:hypothetical protein [Kangiella aquimarina]|uniref:Uncharacterized protein n=1 Tax=Kangiella aquimarina TaxID=261965 RepID=A0ABZ0X269_9GAMM|nr:hypothetical protein [Kangiella aquimarina]WQG84681.1 hypothetical protein SR900_09425 [Kangiella aquimarina]